MAFRDDPLGFVRFIFPWGQAGTALADKDGPDVWQEERLRRLGEAVRARRPWVPGSEKLGAYQAATATGHGTGKSALTAWVVLWFMSTRVNPFVVVTANTAPQLEEKTWRELALWHGRAINESWFVHRDRQFYMKGRRTTWRASAVPWTKERSEAFAGAHGDDVLMIFDEASAIDDSIWEVAEGALTTSGVVWMVFGNPTRNTGRFRECWRKFAHRWDTMEVDSREAKAATNKQQLLQMVEDYGEDSDIVRVRVRGLFPRYSNRQLISEDLVQRAVMEFDRRYGREKITRALEDGPEAVRRFEFLEEAETPWILSLDAARFGPDKSVLALRVGKTGLILAKYQGLNGPQLAYRVAEWINGLKPDVVFVDAVGVGASAYDTLVDLGYEAVEVQSGIAAVDDRKYFNRRAEMWDRGAHEWLKAGGSLLADQELISDLCAPEYSYASRGERMLLESKEDMRMRGLRSPDSGDALVQTFFMPVAPSRRREAEAERIARKLRESRGWRDGGGGDGTTWMSM